MGNDAIHPFRGLLLHTYTACMSIEGNIYCQMQGFMGNRNPADRMCLDFSTCLCGSISFMHAIVAVSQFKMRLLVYAYICACICIYMYSLNLSTFCYARS